MKCGEVLSSSRGEIANTALGTLACPPTETTVYANHQTEDAAFEIVSKGSVEQLAECLR
jgi:hypothetical protein